MHPYITKYRNAYKQTLKFGESDNEQTIRGNFINLINAFAKDRKLELIVELRDKSNHTIPDGTLKDLYSCTYGYYEAKDPKDDLDQEIQVKLEQKNYNSENILFENARIAILYQNNQEVYRVDIQKDDRGLEEIIIRFLDFKKQEIKDFYQAIETFKEKVPNLTQYLRQKIDNTQDNQTFILKREQFLQQCKQEINPNILNEDIREMIIQHFLTGKLFNTVFFRKPIFTGIIMLLVR